MANAPAAAARSRRKTSAPDATRTTGPAAATVSPTGGRPTLADFAATRTVNACPICTHPDHATIEDGLRDGYPPGTVARYLRIVCNDKTNTDTLRKRIVRHIEAGHVES